VNRLRLRAAVALCALLATACGTGAVAEGRDSPVRVVAAFYPLQWVAERVGGNSAQVETLTKAGAEPHDLELTPRDVATIAEADIVAYLSGFQPAVDAAVEQEAGEAAYDAARDADLDLSYTPIEEGRRAGDDAGATDPHFWLDPIRLADVADGMAQRLAALDPGRRAGFEDRAAALRADLQVLDRDLRGGLARCLSKDLVTSHNAFGYLARRYGLRQVGITGLTPETEPNPADQARVTRFVEDNDVRTIYYETLVSPAVAETIALETGVRTAVLDPLEGLSETSAGDDYLAVMRANLASLRAGQRCR
jgi:zinc transport system substrate-binding protein